MTRLSKAIICAVCLFSLSFLFAPTTFAQLQASEVFFTDVNDPTPGYATIHWTRGGGSACAVFLKETDVGSPTVYDYTTYTANADFTAAADIGDGWKCVYNDIGTFVLVSSLTPGKIYRAMAIEYNGSGGSEIYYRNGGSNNPTNSGILVNAWSPMTNPSAGITLRGVWGSAFDNVIAVGDGGKIFQFNGTDWAAMTSNTTQNLFSVWGLGPSDMFAVGAGGEIVHYSGGADWTQMTSNTGLQLQSVWGAAYDNVYAAGAAGTIQRYNGSTWSGETSNTTKDLGAVWGSTGTDIYAAGIEQTIVHSNGTAWSVSQTVTSTPAFTGIWGLNNTDIFISGLAGQILRFNGTGWDTMVSNTGNDLQAIWGASLGDIYCVGSAGTILHYTGSTWQDMSPSGFSSVTFYGIWGASWDNVFAVGTGGTILHYGPVVLTTTTTVPVTTTTTTVSPCSAPVFMSPGGSIGNSRPYYMWYPVSGVTQYQLAVYSPATGTYTSAWTDVATACPGGYMCNIHPEYDLQYGTYEWWVNTDGDCGMQIKPDNSSVTFSYTSSSTTTTAPVLTGHNFFGGGGDDHSAGIAFDYSGNMYIAGYSSQSWNGPFDTPPLLPFNGGANDVFVAKFGPGNVYLWHMFLGGAGDDICTGLAVDFSGYIYVTGHSTAAWDSSNCGVPLSGYEHGAGSDYDLFVAQLYTGGGVAWHSFHGGTGDDKASDIKIDPYGNVYVAGFSASAWGSPIEPFAGGGSDGLLLKCDSAGARLWHTFMGDAAVVDYCTGLALDNDGNPYVAGWGGDWGPAPVNPYTGNRDGFVAKYNVSGYLLWNTFLGSAVYEDYCTALAVDLPGGVTVAGYSYGSWGAPLNAYADGSPSDAFVAQLDNMGQHVWHTFLGGSGSDYANAVILEPSGAINVTGSSDATWGAPLIAYDAGSDGFAAKLDKSGSLLWNTFIGSSGNEQAFKAAFDHEFRLYVLGETDDGWGSPVFGYTAGIDTFVSVLEPPTSVSAILMPAEARAQGAQWKVDNSPWLASGQTYTGITVGNHVLTYKPLLGWYSPSDKNIFVPGNVQITDTAFYSPYSAGLVQSLFLGGTALDQVTAVALNTFNNELYVLGTSQSQWGSAVEPFNGGTRDVFLAKLDSSGYLVWTTFIGGTGDDYACTASLAVDNIMGNVYLAGRSSTAWGTPLNAWGGQWDTFVAKVSSTGNLMWHTFLGSPGIDPQLNNRGGLAIDAGENVYVASSIPGGWGSPARAYSGGIDCAVAMFNYEGTLMWNTFLGSTGDDYGQGLALDGLGSVYVGGYGDASWGAPKRGFTAGFDVFAAKLAASDGTLLWNTFLGGAGNDQGGGIAATAAGAACVAGWSTASWNTPITVKNNGGNADGFLAKLDVNGNLLWNTFLGVGAGLDSFAHGVAFDDAGAIYATGFANGTFATPLHPYTGGNDIFIAKFGPGGSLLWNGFWGSTSQDCGSALAVRPAGGKVFAAGWSDGMGWGIPIRPFSGSQDGVVITFDESALQKVPNPLPDTGQTMCYDNSNLPTACVSTGQDGQYTINSPQYTKLDVNDIPLSAGTPTWIMVRDEVTGLVWEAKHSLDSTVNYLDANDADNTYTWQDAQTSFITQLNTQNYGGHNDWRLPTVQELATIVDSDIANPSISAVFFPPTVSDGYWSSTANVYDSGYPWAVNFAYGDTFQGDATHGYYARAVRGTSAGLTDNLIDNGDGTVSDTNTGLQWQQATAPGYTWQQAIVYSESLDLGGYSDWRLPNWKELQTIIDYSTYSPAIESMYFPGTAAGNYWSSTTYNGNAASAWAASFDYGSVSAADKSGSYAVRSVRGGQRDIQGSVTIVAFEAAPVSGYAPLSVNFSCEALSDMGAGIVQYRWDFDGDHLIDSTTGVNTASHLYSTPGMYYARVIAVNSNGQFAGSSQVMVQVYASITSTTTTIYTGSSTTTTYIPTTTTSVKIPGWDTMAPGMTMQTLWGVWGSSGTDVFAVGDAGTILQFNGTGWAPTTYGTASLLAVAGAGGTDVHAAGTGGTILHFSGVWNTDTSPTPSDLRGIWVEPGVDSFAVGSGGVIVHDNGAGWAVMDSGITTPLNAVWGSSATDVFAVGAGGVILHFDGSSWSPMTSGISYDLNGVWGTAADNVYAVGWMGTILHYDGSLWSAMTSMVSTGLNSVWGSSAGDVWAVGDAGTILHFSGVGLSWNVVTTGVCATLHGVWGSGPDNVFAVGYMGLILHFTGGAMGLPFAVPDTGQTQCYDNVNPIACPLVPGAAFSGQDASYTINPAKYTKLSDNGTALADNASTWSMVRDEVTGLVWENKTTDLGIHDMNNTYTWQDAQNLFIYNLNMSNYGGHSDWRLPTMAELFSIADLGTDNPSINTTFFVNTLNNHYWSSDTYAVNPAQAWYVSFSTGYALYLDKSNAQWVRAVRSDRVLPTIHFADNGDGTITDTNTGLMWQQASAPGTYSWQQALDYSETLILNNDGGWTNTLPNASLAKYADWRLPTAKELETIVDYSVNPPVNATFFPSTQAADYWTSTTYNSIAGNTWTVYFDSGGLGSKAKTGNYYVRAVRQAVTGPSTSTTTTIASSTSSSISTTTSVPTTTTSSISTTTSVPTTTTSSISTTTSVPTTTTSSMSTTTSVPTTTTSSISTTTSVPTTTTSSMSTTTSVLTTTTSSISTTTSISTSSVSSSTSSTSTTISVLTTTSSTTTTATVPGTTTTTSTAMVLDFTATPVEGVYPLAVQFSIESSASITSAAWDFGDGGTATGMTPSHTYQSANDYMVMLTVTLVDGSTAMKSKIGYIHVVENAPVAAFTVSETEGEAPLTVVFTDTSTGTITSREWSFGDGQTGDSGTERHNYSAAGQYTVTLKVTGPDGTSKAVNYITVNPGNRSHAVSGMISGVTSGAVDVSLSSTTLNMTTQTVAAGAYSFDGVPNGLYQITPIRAGYVFDPAAADVRVLGRDVNGVDFSASVLGPAIEQLTIMPARASADNSMQVTITARVSHPAGLAAISSVTADLSAIAGSLSAPLYDNGAAGDITAGDGVYTLVTTVAAATQPGLKALGITASDTGGHASTAFAGLDVYKEYQDDIPGQGGTRDYGINNSPPGGQTLRFILTQTDNGSGSPPRSRRADSSDCSATMDVISPGGTITSGQTNSAGQTTVEVPNAQAGQWDVQLGNPCETTISVGLESSIAGTGIVSGLVVDSRNGTGIDAVSLLSSAGMSARTNGGSYVMLHPSGVYTLNTSASGYLSAMRTVAVNAGGSTEMNIALDNGTAAGGCIFRSTMQQGSARLQALRSFRDSVLAQTERGRGYMQLYYRYSPEVLLLMKRDKELAGEISRCIAELFPLVEAMLQGKQAAPGPEQRRLFTGCLEKMRARAKPGLRSQIDALLNSFAASASLNRLLQ